MKALTSAALTFALSTTAALAGNGVIDKVDFAGVPKGTKCGANAPNAKSVKVRTKRHETRILVRGDATDATFYCVLPNGEQLIAILPNLPAGTRAASLQVAPDLSGIAFYDYGGLRRLDVAKAARRVK